MAGMATATGAGIPIRTLLSSGSSTTPQYPTLGSIYNDSNILGQFTSASTFNALVNSTNNQIFDVSTLPNPLAGYNMLVFKDLPSQIQFKYNNQTCNISSLNGNQTYTYNYTSTTAGGATIPNIYYIGGFGSGSNVQNWGNIGALLAYNSILTEPQVQDIYSKFSSRFVYNMPPLDAITTTYYVTSNLLNGNFTVSVSGINPTGLPNLYNGSLIQFNNVGISASALSLNTNYYITNTPTVTNDFVNNITNLTFTVSSSYAGSPISLTPRIPGSGSSSSVYYSTMVLVNTYSIAATYIGNNLFQLVSGTYTTGLYPGLQVVFSGTAIGSFITLGTVYYILTIPDLYTFTISTTFNTTNNLTNVSPVILTNQTIGASPMTMSFANSIAASAINTITTAKYIPNQTNNYVITGSDATTNTINCLSTKYLTPGQAVQFSASFANIIVGATYYILYIASPTAFTITTTFTAPSTFGSIYQLSSSSIPIQITTNGLTAYYSGESWNASTNTWVDVMGYNSGANNISVAPNSIKVYNTPKKDYTGSNIIPGVNSYSYIGGTTSSTVTFPQTFNTGQYTIIWVARYAGVHINAAGGQNSIDSGVGSNACIFTNTNNTSPGYINWVSGFSNAYAGTAVHGAANIWTATSTQNNNNNWIIGVDQQNLFRANGVTYIPTNSLYYPPIASKFNMTINGNPTVAASDWMVASVLCFNYELSFQNILTLENWLSQKYNIPIYPCIYDKLSASAAASAVAAYSVFLLSSTYNGPTLNIRRSSDNAQIDFYADINGNLGTAPNATGQSLNAWLSTANSVGVTGYITTWYDQTGNGNNAAQTNTSLQPVYSTSNNYIDFTNNKYMSIPDGTVPSVNSSYTVTIKHNNVDTTANSKPTFLSSGSGGNFQQNTFYVVRTADIYSGGTYANYWTSYTTNYYLSYYGITPYINLLPIVTTYKYDSKANSLTNYYVNNYYNAVISTGSTIRASTTNNNYIGYNYDYKNGYLNGQLYYMYIFNSALNDTDRNILETNDANTVPAAVTGFQAVYVGSGNVQFTWNPVPVTTSYVRIFIYLQDGSLSILGGSIYNSTFYDTISTGQTLNANSQYIFTIIPYNNADAVGIHGQQSASSLTITTAPPYLSSYSFSTTINSFSIAPAFSPGTSGFTVSWVDSTHQPLIYPVTSSDTINFYYTYDNTKQPVLYFGAPVVFITNNGTTEFGGITLGKTYYIVPSPLPMASSFAVATTVGGTALTLTTGTGNMQLIVQSYNVTSSTAGTSGVFTYTNRNVSTILYVGAAVTFSSTISTSSLFGGVSANTTYYIISIPTTTTFQVSATLGGSALSLSQILLGSMSVTLSINSSGVGNAQPNNQIVPPQNPYIINCILSGNQIVCTSVNGLTVAGSSSAVGTPIQFLGGVFGGILPNTTYYILSVNTTTSSFTISQTQNGTQFTLTAGYGSMYMSPVYQCSLVNNTTKKITLYQSSTTPDIANLYVGEMVTFTSTMANLLANTTYYITAVDTVNRTISITDIVGSTSPPANMTSFSGTCIMLVGYYTSPTNLITSDVYNVAITPYSVPV